MRRALIAAIAGYFAVTLPAAAQQYSAQQKGDVVQLQDTKTQTVVSIIPAVGDIVFEMTIKGQNVLRWPYSSVEEFKSRPGLSGIPFLGPWANRLDEQAFYANGKKYAFDRDLGNIRGAVPIHGFLTTSNQWQVVEVRADARSAWITSTLEFYRQPTWIKQWPFAQVEVILGPNFRSVVIYSPNPANTGRGSQNIASAAQAGGSAQEGRGVQTQTAQDRTFICFEPMAAVTNALNLAHQGLYKELQSVPPGGTWRESFWVRPSGF